jgi:drug/metabolite transporter (DMT)-like permease
MAAPPLSRLHALSRPSILPYALLTVSALIWAGNWVIGRGVRDTIPPVALTFWRWAIAALLLAPFALPRLKGEQALLRRHWRILLILGGTGIAFFQLLIYVGLHFTTAVNGVLMNAAQPLFMMLIAWLIDRQTVTRRQLAGMLISFGGILAIVSRGNLMDLGDFRLNIGDAMILLAMPTWGVYSVMLRRRPREIDGLAFVFLIAATGTVLLAPAYLAEAWFIRPMVLTWQSAGAILYVACFASILAYLCWNRGVDMVGPNKAGFTAHLIPAFGTILAVLFLGEEVHAFHLIGIAVILFGVSLATSARARR